MNLKDSENKNYPSYDELQINLKIKTSKLFNDVQLDGEEEDDFNKRKFKWHCEVKIKLKLNIYLAWNPRRRQPREAQGRIHQIQQPSPT